MSRTAGGQLWRVGLALTALVYCFGSIACKRVPYYLLKETREIESSHLMDELSKPLKRIDQVTGTKVSVGKQVAHILARAKHKGENKVILGEFKVEDLLQLNNIRIEDCHVDVLAKRRQFCEDKFAEKHANLYSYCTKTNTNLLDWCNYQIDELIKITLIKTGETKSAEKLRNIIRKVAKSEGKKIKAVTETGQVTPGEVFNSIQAKGDDSFKAKIASVCGPLDRALNLNFEIKLKDKPIDFDMNHWVDFLRYCRAIIELSPPVKDEAQTESDGKEENEDEVDLDEGHDAGNSHR